MRTLLSPNCGAVSIAEHVEVGSDDSVPHSHHDFPLSPSSFCFDMNVIDTVRRCIASWSKGGETEW
jgi:hypothetical protein